MKHSLLALALACSFSTVARAADDAGASESDLELAKAHFNTGQIDYDKGRFVDAAKEFEEAYRLSGRAPLLYNMGKSYDGASDFAHALVAYRRFIASGPTNAGDLDFAKKRVALLESLVGHIALTNAVAGSSVLLDGAAVGHAPMDAMNVNPGRHNLELQHEGYANFKQSIAVPVGGTVTVAAKQVDLVKVVRVEVPQKERTPVYKTWWLWTTVSAVVVAGVVTAVVLTTNSSSSGLNVQLPTVR
jgi:tetratricopeptide (TPR) repeat protein